MLKNFTSIIMVAQVRNILLSIMIIVISGNHLLNNFADNQPYGDNALSKYYNNHLGII
jgi:hypothetical protein